MPDRKIITMKKLQVLGRGVNQMFRYAFLSQYAREHDAKLQLPPWCGTHLFGCPCPTISVDLPEWIEPGGGRIQPTPPSGDELVGHDFWGHAQYHTDNFRGDTAFHDRFTPVPDVAERLRAPLDRLREHGGWTIGIHLRRGDYGRRIFPIIPTSWYLKWLDENWDKYEDPRLFIATEDASLVSDFAKYAPETVETLGLGLRDTPMVDCTYLDRDLATGDVRALDWYPDFYLLSKCRVILGPSSTFSFFASMLAHPMTEYYRASLAAEGFVKTGPWNAYPLLREHVRDYRHLEGISVKTNKYW